MAVSPTLLVSALTSVLVACANAFVALRLMQRKGIADEPSVFALRCFSVWWGFTAINQFLGSGLYFAAAFGWTDLTVQVAYSVVQRILLTGSLFGLLYYLVFVASGRRAFAFLLVAYGMLTLLELYDVFVRAPDHILVSRWRTDIAGSSPGPGWLAPLNAAALILPPVVASVWYLTVLRHIKDRSQRARVLAVSIGLMAWWVVAVIAGGQQTFDNDGLQLANRLIQGLVAILVLEAYQPTPWVQQRFRIEPFAGPA